MNNPVHQYPADQRTCVCDRCGRTGNVLFFARLYDFGGLLKNKWGLPNGDYCIGCLGRIENKQQDTGRYIGQTEIERLEAKS